MTYTYNLGGAMVEQQYPSGRVVKSTLDATGDLSMVMSKENSSAIFKTYVNDFTYNAAGAVTSLKLGNGKFESTQFNSRLQPTRIALGASVGDTSSLKLDYEYGATASVNNGNVTKQTITVPGMSYPLIQNYTYDSLNRLDDASETSNGAQTWRQDFSYDRYGNRNFVESNTSFAGFDKLCNSNTELCATLRKQINPGINSGNNNRINSGQDYTYDAAGNTLTDANGQIFVYDGENKQVKASTSSGTVGEYFYDGDGKRVKKYVPGTGETTIFVYDDAGKQIAEYSTVVADVSTAKVAYLTADHLGSPRINTDVTGAVTSRHDYHPFGEEIARAGSGNDTVRKNFTGYERDAETNLDYALTRMYSYTHGRFRAADNVLNDSYTIEPSSWNLYVYVRNNPLRFVDPTGEEIWIYLAGNLDNQRVRYRNGKLYTSDGSIYDGDDEYARKVQSDLNELKNDDSYGAYVIDTLDSSDMWHHIYRPIEGSGASSASTDLEARDNYRPSGSMIAYDPDSTKIGDPIVVGLGKTVPDKGPARITLAHELWHSFEADQGRLDNRRRIPWPAGRGLGPRIAEINAVVFENIVRGGIPGMRQRTTYGGMPIPTQYMVPRRDLNNSDLQKMLRSQELFCVPQSNRRR